MTLLDLGLLITYNNQLVNSAAYEFNVGPGGCKYTKRSAVSIKPSQGGR